MTHRERAAAALTLQVPDHVPTFELEFQLAEEMFGKPLLPPELEPGNIEKLSSLERERKICEMAEYTAYVYRELDYSIIPLMMIGDFDYWQAQGKLPPEFELYARYVRAFTEGKVLLAHHGDGTYSIPDGNIMPILDQLVECGPHALHSLDPMAGVDIREVKRLVGDKVCLCGNVHCAALQTGTEEEVVASAEYCLTYGKPHGGYIFCTSNVPFKGMPPERYRLILDVWKRMRAY